VNGHVAPFGIKVEGLGPALKAELYVGVCAPEPGDARHQPPGAKGRQDGHRNELCAISGRDRPGDGSGKPRQVVIDIRSKARASVGELHSATGAAKKPRPDQRLEVAHLPADRALRQAQLLGGERETLVPRSGREATQSGKGREVEHESSSMSFRHQYPSFPCILIAKRNH
jgi:hypothetical protein